MENKVYWTNCSKYDEQLIEDSYQELLINNHY